MKYEDTYRSYKEFEQMGRRKIGTFQLCIDALAKDLYYDQQIELDNEEEIKELDFDF